MIKRARFFILVGCALAITLLVWSTFARNHPSPIGTWVISDEQPFFDGGLDNFDALKRIFSKRMYFLANGEFALSSDKLSPPFGQWTMSGTTVRVTVNVPPFSEVHKRTQMDAQQYEVMTSTLKKGMEFRLINDVEMRLIIGRESVQVVYERH